MSLWSLTFLYFLFHIFTILSMYLYILNYSSNPTSIVIAREIATSKWEDARQVRRVADRTWSVPGGRRCHRKVSTGMSPDYEGDISWLPAPGSWQERDIGTDSIVFPAIRRRWRRRRTAFGKIGETSCGPHRARRAPLPHGNYLEINLNFHNK